MSTGNGAAAGPLDSLFAKTNVVVLVLFGLCCNGIALILSIICLVTAKDPVAKKNATITLIVAAIFGGGLVVLNFVGGGLAALFGR